MEFNIELKSEEIVLVGSWKLDNGKVVADEICQRIQKLVANYLEKVAVDKTGWETLYRDSNDKRYWLLTYPNSDWHGGGPPSLKMITPIEVYEKFGIN